MKIRYITILICAAACVPSFADAPRRGSPTVPPSEYQQSLRPGGNESVEYQLRNELITGNVPGGKYFRGTVPYSPRYEFSGSLPSNEINSFIRRSSITPYRDQYPTRYDSYYLPSRTISSLHRLGKSGLVLPQVTFPGGTGRFQLPPPTKQIYDPNPYRRRRPLESNINELELKMLRQAQKQNPDFQEIRKGIQNNVIRDILSKEKMEKTDAEKLLKIPTEKAEDFITEKLAEVVKPLDLEKPVEPGMEDELVESLEEIDEKTKQDQETEEQIEEPEIEEPKEEETTDDRTGPSELENRFLKMDHQTAMGIMYPYKTYKEYAKAKFNSYIKIGDGFMKQGKFYKAADAYELASIYDLKSARAYGRRGLALFAAGEYLTCVEYMEMALSRSPQYAKEKIDLKTFIGQDVVDKRFANILKWYESNQSPSFMLLASYIYYQLGDLEQAARSVDLAAEKMAGFASVDAMRSAIESAQSRER